MDTTLVYGFGFGRVGQDIQLSIEPTMVDRIRDWLGEWLHDEGPAALVFAGEGLTIARALIDGDHEEPPEQGVSLWWGGIGIGLLRPSVERWAADLKAREVSVYQALPRDVRIVPINEPK